MSVTPGTLTYNGYTFSDETQIVASMDFVYDEAGRTVAETRWTLTVHSVIYPRVTDTNNADHLQDVRRLLAAPGKRLILTDWGFGPDISLNSAVTNTAQDVSFGPKPTSLVIKPVGATNSAVIDWQIQFHVPYCEDGGNYQGLQSLNYAISSRVDAFGWTTRTVTGYLQIAMTRTTDDTVPDTADNYRNLINVPRLGGFTREEEFNLSHDKSRLEFTISDTEIQSFRPWPSDVMNIEASHEAEVNPRVRVRMDHNLSVTLDLTTQNRERALTIFKAIVSSLVQPSEDAGYTVFLDKLKMTEQLFGSSFSFNLTWRVLSESAAAAWFNDQGFFIDLGYNWTDWLNSTAYRDDNYGRAGLRSREFNDHLVDLCGSNSGVTEAYTKLSLTSPPASTELCNETPTPSNSWIHWEATFELRRDNSRVYEVELGSTSIEAVTYDVSDTTGKTVPITTSTDLNRVVAQAPPGSYFVFRGKAERLGYPIPEPIITSAGGVDLELMEESRFLMKDHGLVNCVRKYSAAWEHVYYVPGDPDVMPASNEGPYADY